MVNWRPDQKKKEKKDNYTIDNSFIDDIRFPNPTENEHTDTTDNLHTDNEGYVNKMNVEKDEDKDGEYKEDNEEDPKSD